MLTALSCWTTYVSESMQTWPLCPCNADKSSTGIQKQEARLEALQMTMAETLHAFA